MAQLSSPDGIAPLMKLLPLSTKTRPRGAFTDISDYLDKEVVSFDELAEEERNAAPSGVSCFCYTRDQRAIFVICREPVKTVAQDVNLLAF